MCVRSQFSHPHNAHPLPRPFPVTAHPLLFQESDSGRILPEYQLTCHCRDDIVLRMTTSQYILLTEAADCFPHPPGLSTLWRYVGSGLNGVRLRTVRSAGRVMTTQRWVDEFVDTLSSRSGTDYHQERQQPADTIRRLHRAGIKLNRDRAVVPGA
jgi:hypothetical protein